MKIIEFFFQSRYWLPLILASLLAAEGDVRAMGAPAFAPNPARDVLLVGYSLVLGGNQCRAPERLAHSLQALMQAYSSGVNVWPIAQGSWALRNELAYLHLSPQVPSSVKTIVLVPSSADFEAASSWCCELKHPRWASRWYKDGIYPTQEDNQVLAQVIFDAVTHF